MTANAPETCLHCDTLIPEEAPDGVCPKCLLSGLAAQDLPPLGETPLEEVRAQFTAFEIEELIGLGGIGRVYRARDPQVDRIVALKILSPERAGDPEWIERFTREAKALARLNHPHIVQVHSFGTDPQPHLVMEFIDGVNLRETMQAGGLAEREAIAIVPKLCDALHYAHENGVLHRDIKPENILIDTEGRVKLVDFGLAKLHDENALPFTLTQSGAKLGTIAYMAPEQVECPAEVDHRADIYSLGVVFYEMLTGELPLGRFPSPSEANGTDPRLDRVVLRTLEKKKEKRFPDAGAMASGIESARHGKLESPSSQRTRLPTWAKILILALTLLVGFPWFAILSYRAGEKVASENVEPEAIETAERVADMEGQAREEEEAAAKRVANSYDAAERWMAEASKTDDPAAKTGAIREVREAMNSDEPEMIYAAVRVFGLLGNITMDRKPFREPLRALIARDDLEWKTRGAAISALFQTNYEPSDVETVLSLVEIIPAENLGSLAAALAIDNEKDFTAKHGDVMLRLLQRGFEAEKPRGHRVTWVPNRSLLGVLWGANVTPEIEELLIDWTVYDTTDERPMLTNSPGYYAFYSALSVIANKSTPAVERLLELASSSDVTNIGGRCLWGMKGTIPDKGDQALAATGTIEVLRHRNHEYQWRQGLELLYEYATTDHLENLREFLEREELPEDQEKLLRALIERLQS